jgi:hypothetical protein
MMIPALLLAAILSTPTNTLLWRRDGAWVYPPKDVGSSSRTAPATILVFRANGEFIEHHCWIIEGQGYITISGGDPHVVVVGTWRSSGTEIRARRLRIERTVRAIGRDPICDRASSPMTTACRDERTSGVPFQN